MWRCNEIADYEHRKRECLSLSLATPLLLSLPLFNSFNHWTSAISAVHCTFEMRRRFLFNSKMSIIVSWKFECLTDLIMHFDMTSGYIDMINCLPFSIALSLSLYLSGNSYSIWSHFLYCGSMQLAIWCGWLHSQFYSGEILRIISTELKIIVTYRIFYSHSIHRPTLSKR